MSVALKKFPTSIVLFLFFFSVYTFTMSGTIQFGDEIEKYRVAQSIVDRHDFSIRPTAERNITGTSGQTYSVYELGQTILEIPVYVLGRMVDYFFPLTDSNYITMLVVGLFNPIVTALTCVLLFKTGLSLGFGYRTCLALSVLFGLATIAWPYTKGFTREPLLAFLVLLSFYTVQRFRQTDGLRWLLAAGSVAGYLVFSKFIQAAIVPVLLMFIAAIIWQHGRETRADSKKAALNILYGLGIFLAPSIMFLAAQSSYALVRYGTIYSGIGGTKVNPFELIWFFFSTSTPVAATVGLLFSGEKSIFLYSPPIVLSLLAGFLWFKRDKIASLLALTLVAVEFASSIARLGWDGGNWWGPRYVVQTTPLLILTLGALEYTGAAVQRVWKVLLALLFAFGVLVQLVGAFSNDRDYLDITGKGTYLAGQIDFLLHRAIESLVIYLSPAGFPVQFNPFGILLILIAALLGAWLFWRYRNTGPYQPGSALVGLGVAALVLPVEFGAFIIWMVAPYPQVLAAQANTKFVAANSFLADGRKCEAAALYSIAIERGTTYQRDAVARLDELLPRPRGTRISAGDLMAEQEKSGDALIEEDGTVTISGEGSFEVSAADGTDVIARGNITPIPAQPNTTYEVLGWIKTENIYGEGFGSLTVSEDDGAYRHIRATDIVLMDETRGWNRFQKTLTTLPTTQRLFIAAGLWKTYGTVWIDGLRVAQIAKDNPASAEVQACK